MPNTFNGVPTVTPPTDSRHNPEGRFEVMAITANGSHPLGRWDLESAARIDLDRWTASMQDSAVAMGDPFVITIRDRWDTEDTKAGKLIGQFEFTPARHMLKPGVPCPAQHAQVGVTVTNDIHTGDTLTGTFRGRVMGVGAPFFDKQGTAIWLTTDHGWEAFIEIDHIDSIEEI